jgi:hypothetical protein
MFFYERGPAVRDATEVRRACLFYVRSSIVGHSDTVFGFKFDGSNQYRMTMTRRGVQRIGGKQQ